MFTVLAAIGPYAITLTSAWFSFSNFVTMHRLGKPLFLHLILGIYQPLIFVYIGSLLLKESGLPPLIFVLFISLVFFLLIVLAFSGHIRSKGVRDDLELLLLHHPAAPPLLPQARRRGVGLLLAGTLLLSAISLAGVGARTCDWLDRLVGASGCTAVLRVHGAVDGIALTPDGVRLGIVARFDEEARRWDLATGRQLSPLRLPAEGESDTYMEDIAWSKDGTLLATGGDSLRIWDADTGKLLRTLNQSVTKAVVFLSDGTLLAGVGDGVEVWSSATEPRTAWLPTPFEIYALDISPDESLLAAGGYGDDTHVQLWALPSYQRLRELPSNTVNDLAFSPNGLLLATSEYNSGPVVWQVSTGTIVWKGAIPNNASKEPGERDSSQSVAFSPDGTFLASGTHDGLLSIWRAEDGTPVALRQMDDWIRNLAWTSWDGGRLAVGLWDDRVELWHVPLSAGS